MGLLRRGDQTWPSLKTFNDCQSVPNDLKQGEAPVLPSNPEPSRTGRPLVKYHVKICAGIIRLYIERELFGSFRQFPWDYSPGRV